MATAFDDNFSIILDGFYESGDTLPVNCEFIPVLNVSLGTYVESEIVVPTGLANNVLLQSTDFNYAGTFKVPAGSYGGPGETFNYGGDGISYNPANDSLYIAGHEENGHLSAEITIPTPVNDANLNNLNTANFIQTFYDAFEGLRPSIDPNEPNQKYLGDHLVYNGKLILNAWSYYDNANDDIDNALQWASHFSRPLDLSVTGQVVGPVTVGNTYPGWVSGFMTEIPDSWKSQFGGPALTGNFGLAIAGIQSWGPSASVFNPDLIGQQSPVPATLLVGYPANQSLYGSEWDGSEAFYSGSTQCEGIIFPENSRSVVFLGNHGIGTFCYGLTPSPCSDPAWPGDGVHMYPYKYQAWAYDALELLKVKNGEILPHEVEPYDYWDFTIPHYEQDDRHLLGGVAYDSTRDRFYFSQRGGNTHAPLIHAFDIDYGSTPSSLPVSITNGEYRINAGAWTSVAGEIEDGDNLQVRHVSSSLSNTATISVLRIGSVNSLFTSRTSA